MSVSCISAIFLFTCLQLLLLHISLCTWILWAFCGASWGIDGYPWSRGSWPFWTGESTQAFGVEVRDVSLMLKIWNCCVCCMIWPEAKISRTSWRSNDALCPTCLTNFAGHVAWPFLDIHKTCSFPKDVFESSTFVSVSQCHGSRSGSPVLNHDGKVTIKTIKTINVKRGSFGALELLLVSFFLFFTTLIVTWYTDIPTWSWPDLSRNVPWPAAINLPMTHWPWHGRCLNILCVWESPLVTLRFFFGQVCAIVAKKFEEHGLAIPADRLDGVNHFCRVFKHTWWRASVSRCALSISKSPLRFGVLWYNGVHLRFFLHIISPSRCCRVLPVAKCLEARADDTKLQI